MIAGNYNFKIERGSSGPTQGLVFRLRALVSTGPDVYENIPYEDVRLSIKKRNTLLLRKTVSDGGITVEVDDDGFNVFTWSPTPDETRLIPVGVVASYELEVWNSDTQIPYLRGTIEGLGGLNDDEVAP